ncbi:sugar nucleotide-binding protein [Halomonas sp. YLGW01]|uniref:sugar nucleotide-binding protein n=1 Tax=Halomonas sp. YLGW01 TaxID=2773308 RepID=UPI001786B294|nr:sugar nucleotide-binding protein [Halomonas sp. YLGW01]
MKLLILDAGHCLSLALAREANRRTDTELVIEAGLELDTDRLAGLAPDAVLIPPLVTPMEIEPAAITAHAEAVERCVACCRELEVPLVWCVSDQLYEDGFDGPIDEHMLPDPRDDGLRRLLAVGLGIRERLPRHLIVRLGPLFALEGGGAWLGDMLDSLVCGDRISAAQDVIFCPTSADAAAMALIGMLQQIHCGADRWGVYHLAGTEPVSAFAFASMVRTQLATRLEGLGLSTTLGELKAMDHHHGHPLRRVLNCRRVLQAFGVHQKPWRLEVGRMLDAWCQAYHPPGSGRTA